MTRLHRLPDGTNTKDSQKYCYAWELLGSSIQKHFFPHHHVYGFDPDFALRPDTRYGNAVTLSLNTVRALLHSPGAANLANREELLTLLGPIIEPKPRDMGFVAVDQIAQLQVGDGIYVANLKSNGSLSWHIARVTFVLRFVNGHVEGVKWKSGKMSDYAYVSDYGIRWSLDPADHAAHRMYPKDPRYPPFKVLKKPVTHPL